jgi:diguanylate cyclase (GGDEF)-like protein/PAS domain S-box-containing protein
MVKTNERNSSAFLGKVEIPLSELIEDIDLQHVEDLASSTPGVRVVVDDSRGNKIAEFGKPSFFYDVIHSIDPSIRCSACFKEKEKNLPREVIIYTCPYFPQVAFVSVPVFIGEQLVAECCVGQIRTGKNEGLNMESLPEVFHRNAEKIFSALSKLPLVPREELLRFSRILRVLLSHELSSVVKDKKIAELEQNLTELREKLKKSEEKLNMAIASYSLVLWEWNIGSEEIVLSNRWSKVPGSSSGEKRITFSSLKKLFHPEDLPVVMKTLFDYLEGKTPFFDCSFRIKKDDNCWKWMHSKGIVSQRNVHGDPIRITGTGVDISLEKEAQAKLRKQSEERGILLDNIDILIWYMKDPLHVERANRAFAEFKGLSAEDLTGKSIWDLFPESVATIIDNNRKVFSSKKTLKTEEWLKNSEGDFRLFSINRSPGLNKNGHMEYIICSASDITERRENEEKLSYMAAHDPLTGALNRHSLNWILQMEETRSRRYSHPMAFVMMDINRFKEINDRLGHQTGDLVLAEIAQLLKKQVRECDLVVRYGGDEFLIVLPETGNEVCVIRDRVLEALDIWNRSSVVLPFELSISMGFSQWDPDSGKSIEECLSEADRVMYLKKKTVALKDKKHK